MLPEIGLILMGGYLIAETVLKNTFFQVREARG